MATPLLRRLQSQNQENRRSSRPLPPIPQQQQAKQQQQQQQEEEEEEVKQQQQQQQSTPSKTKSLPQPPSNQPLASTSNPPPPSHNYNNSHGYYPSHPQTNHYPSHHMHQTTIQSPDHPHPSPLPIKTILPTHSVTAETTTTPHQPVVPQLVFEADPAEEKENRDDQSHTKIKKPFIEQHHPQPIPIISPRRISSQTSQNSRSIPQIILPTDDDDDTGNKLDHEPDNQIEESSRINSLKPTGQSNSLTCSGCQQIIAGRIVHALNQRWHPDCFTCHHCRLALEHVAFYEHEGKAYCGVDYDDLFSLKCYHCNTSINEDSYVTLDDPSLEGGPRHYHKLHLFCSECGDPFINPKSLEERSRISKQHGIDLNTEVKNDDEPKPFVLYKGFPYCELCDIKLHRPKCAQCKQPVVDEFIHALHKTFHSHCFVCFLCHLPFSNNQFFLLDLENSQLEHNPSNQKKLQKLGQQVPICLNCYS